MRRVRFFALLLVLALIAAACSSIDDGIDPHPLPEFNPPNTGIAPPNAVAMFNSLVGPDRCTWSGGGDPILWVTCADDAADAIADAATAQHDLQTALDGAFGRTNGVCIVTPGEFVSPAPEEIVGDLTGATVNSDAGELPAGLVAYLIDDPLAAVEELLAQSIPAAPRYVLLPSQKWKFGPGSVALAADPPIADTQGDLQNSRHGVVTVIDTRDSEGSETSTLDPVFVGHSEFITGIIRRLAPRVTVVERSAFAGGTAGMPTEHSVIAAIDEALDNELSEGGVVNLSLGTYACTPGDVPLELAARLGEISASGADIVFVAAAGNDGFGSDSAPFWPAGFAVPDFLSDDVVSGWLAKHDELDRPYKDFFLALDALRSVPHVVGVGALVDTGSQWLAAEFSNQAAVTVWAPGANIVSTHPGFEGYAQWDGTSFAAPHVAALIAGCRPPGGTYQASLADAMARSDC